MLFLKSSKFKWYIMASFFSKIPGLKKAKTEPYSTKDENRGNPWKNEHGSYFLNLSLDEKRKLYSCGDTYVTLKGDDLVSWPALCRFSGIQKMKKIKTDGDKIPDAYKIMPELNGKVCIWQGDITKLEIDAIVNAANQALLGGGGVDGCIHRAAGPTLLKECRLLNGCHTGDSKITSGHKLPAKYIIHTVGPMGRNESKLKGCYESCLQFMLEYEMRTIAFPCIATGIYGYPNRDAAHVALQTVREWLEKHHEKVDKIIFCTFMEKDFLIYHELMKDFYFPCPEIPKKPVEDSSGDIDMNEFSPARCEKEDSFEKRTNAPCENDDKVFDTIKNTKQPTEKTAKMQSNAAENTAATQSNATIGIEKKRLSDPSISDVVDPHAKRVGKEDVPMKESNTVKENSNTVDTSSTVKNSDSSNGDTRKSIEDKNEVKTKTVKERKVMSTLNPLAPVFTPRSSLVSDSSRVSLFSAEEEKQKNDMGSKASIFSRSNNASSSRDDGVDMETSPKIEKTAPTNDTVTPSKETSSSRDYGVNMETSAKIQNIAPTDDTVTPSKETSSSRDDGVNMETSAKIEKTAPTDDTVTPSKETSSSRDDGIDVETSPKIENIAPTDDTVTPSKETSSSRDDGVDMETSAKIEKTAPTDDTVTPSKEMSSSRDDGVDVETSPKIENIAPTDDTFTPSKETSSSRDDGVDMETSPKIEKTTPTDDTVTPSKETSSSRDDGVDMETSAKIEKTAPTDDTVTPSKETSFSRDDGVDMETSPKIEKSAPTDDKESNGDPEKSSADEESISNAAADENCRNKIEGGNASSKCSEDIELLLPEVPSHEPTNKSNL